VDLTKDYPRSVRAKWQGIVQLGRAIDKGRATAHGNVGEYHYQCPMDQAVFDFLGIDGPQLLETIRRAESDPEIEAFTRPFVAAKTAEEIARWNREWLEKRPEGESLDFFNQLRSQIAPDRADVVTWPDLLDLDEKREVPRRTPTAA
jgi:hypothetical protein